MPEKIFSKSFLMLFLKRFLKYTVVLALLLLMLIPVISASYNFARNTIVNNSTQNLQDSLTLIERDLSKAQQLSSLIGDEDAYTDLLRVKGSAQPENYIDISKLQTKFRKLCLVHELTAMTYITFRDNPIFISNYMSADDYRKISPVYINYKTKSMEEWVKSLYQKTDPLILIPEEEIAIDNTYGTDVKGIVCAINMNQKGNILSNSILVTVLDSEKIIRNMLPLGRDDKAFLYVTDFNQNLLMSRNYPGDQALPVLGAQEYATVNGTQYLILQAAGDVWGIHLVYGIPMSAFHANIQDLLKWTLFYLVAGILIILLVSLLFSVRETMNIGGLVKVASGSAKLPYQKNEYSFIKSAFQTMSEESEEREKQIKQLNKQMEASVLESLLMRGCYSVKDEAELMAYFDKPFEFFCVSVFHLQYPESTLLERSLNENVCLDIGHAMSEAFSDSRMFLSLIVSRTEIVYIVFLDETDSTGLGGIKNRLFQVATQARKAQDALVLDIGLSSPAHSLANIRTAYLQAKNAISLGHKSQSGEVYQFDLPRTSMVKSLYDSNKIARCYDYLIMGDKGGVLAFFSELKDSTAGIFQSEQDNMQLFFSLRQPVYNAYVQILTANRLGGAIQVEPLVFPEYAGGCSAEQILEDFLEFSLTLCGIVEHNRKSHNDSLKNKVLSYIQENFCDPNLSAPSLSSELLVSEKYLYSVVKEATGKTLGKYIEDLRITKAQTLLRTTELSNAQIYPMCGFGSENTFYRIFLKQHGISPAVWKARKAEDKGE